MISAWMMLAKSWKLADVPAKDEWFQKIRYMLLMDILTAIINFNHGNFKAINLF